MTDHKLIDIPESVSGSILVIDGDFLAFKVSSVLETRCVKVFDEDEELYTFKNKTAFKKSDQYNPEFIVKDSQVLKSNYKISMTYITKSIVNNLLKSSNTTTLLIVLGGETNFRDRLSLPVTYKGNRIDKIRPLALKETKNNFSKLYTTIYAEDEEADDLISKFQYKSYIEKNKDIIVCTPDKDAKGTPGNLFHPEDKYLTSIEGLGFVSIKQTSKIKLIGEGRKFFYSQLLTGDPVDNYFPCDIYKQKNNVSKKSAILSDFKVFNLLKDLNTDKECLKVIKDVYYNWYKDVSFWTDYNGNKVEGDWLDILQMYCDTVHMRRWDNDRIDIKKVLSDMEIT